MGIVPSFFHCSVKKLYGMKKISIVFAHLVEVHENAKNALCFGKAFMFINDPPVTVSF